MVVMSSFIEVKADGRGRLGTGLTPYHLMELIDGPGHFEFSRDGFRHIRTFALGDDYEIGTGGKDWLDLNGVRCGIAEGMPDEVGRWVPEAGEVIEFGLPPLTLPSRVVRRNDGPWLEVHE